MQIFLTEDFTFMCIDWQNVTSIPSPKSGVRDSILGRSGASHDPCPTPVGVKSHFHSIADKHLDPVQTHFPSEVREHPLATLDLYLKKSVGKRLIDDSINNLRFGHICVAENSRSLE